MNMKKFYIALIFCIIIMIVFPILGYNYANDGERILYAVYFAMPGFISTCLLIIACFVNKDK